MVCAKDVTAAKIFLLKGSNFTEDQIRGMTDEDFFEAIMTKLHGSVTAREVMCDEAVIQLEGGRKRKTRSKAKRRATASKRRR